MKIMKRAAVIAVTMMCIASVFSGCTTSKDANGNDEAKAKAAAETLAKEMKQNDYRGGVIRTGQLKNAVLSTMETMKSNNITLRESNPNSFWTTEGYQDFVVNFLSEPIINDTQWFNEEETTWEDIVDQMNKVQSSFTIPSDGSYTLKPGIEVQKNEKDDYTILNVPVEGLMFTNKDTSPSDFTGIETYKILYDCDKDWCKAYSILDLNTELIPDIVPELFEYARLNNDTFVIQTSRERLLVILDPSEQDVDFTQRTVKEFYYSKLVQDGMRTTFKPYQALAEYDEETGEYLEDNSMMNKAIQGYKVINGNGDIATQYGKSDSLFLNPDVSSIGIDWVFEDKSLQQAICYKDSCLVATTYNKLTESYERFTYVAESVTDPDKHIQELINLVEKDELVGKRAIPDIEIPEQDIDAIMKNKKENEGTDTEDKEGDTETESNAEGDTESKSDPVDDAANSALEEMREIANSREDGDIEYVDSVG